MRTRETQSVDDIRTAVRELSTRAELARGGQAPTTPPNSIGACGTTARNSARGPSLRVGYWPRRRNVLRWEDDGRDVVVHGDVADPQHDDRVIAREDLLFDRALQPRWCLR